MIGEEIEAKLFQLQDKDYRDFQSKLIPTVDTQRVIGVRTPELRKYAKALVKEQDIEEFLGSLPHEYFDEDQLHAFIVSEIKDYDRCMDEVSRFLPYVDNWATCDQLNPKAFKRHREELLIRAKEWIGSDETYMIRFGIKMLMSHFLDEDFDPAHLETVASIVSDEYYVNMMRSWYFATALAKQYEAALPYIEDRRLDVWTHNKAIQKSVESYRIADEQKTYLKTLKVKNK